DGGSHFDDDPADDDIDHRHADHAAATQFAEKGAEGRCRGGVAHASFHACADHPSGLVVMAASEYPVGTMSPRTGDPYRGESTPAGCDSGPPGKPCLGGVSAKLRRGARTRTAGGHCVGGGVTTVF